jgi:predicted Zn-dependent protease
MRWSLSVVVCLSVLPEVAVAQLLPEAAPEPTAPATTEPLQPLPWQLSQQYPIDEEDPESRVPTTKQRDRNPLEFGYFLQDLLSGAEMAQKAGAYHAVVRYYRAVVKAVPDRAKGWSKLCEAYAVVNDHERAAKASSYALDLPGTEMQDFTRFVHETLLKPGELSADDRAKIATALEHLEKQPDPTPPAFAVAANHLRCETAVKAKDGKMLEACTAVLARHAPNDPKTVVFEWTLAVQRGHTEAAGRLLDRARQLKVPAENVERMEAATYRGKRRAGVWFAIGLIALTGAAGVAAFLRLRKRRDLIAQTAR